MNCEGMKLICPYCENKTEFDRLIGIKTTTNQPVICTVCKRRFKVDVTIDIKVLSPEQRDKETAEAFAEAVATTSALLAARCYVRKNGMPVWVAKISDSEYPFAIISVRSKNSGAIGVYPPLIGRYGSKITAQEKLDEYAKNKELKPLMLDSYGKIV